MQVAILMGSKSDWPVMQKAVKVLKELEVDTVVRVLSAHRTPAKLSEFINTTDAQVFIAAAGGAAHLAGAVAAQTSSPVIGVPISNSLHGLDALLATVQMPPGVPVATVAIDGAENAAVLAVQMLALKDSEEAEELLDRLWDYREKRQAKVVADNEEVNALVAAF